MKAVVITTPGELGSIQWMDVPVPAPRAGEVQVRIEAAGVNPADWKVALRGMPGWCRAQVLGLDGVGVVSALGAGVHAWRTGERVWFHHGLTRLGAFAEFTCVEAALLSPAPASLTAVAAAAVPTPGFTAWQLLTRRLRWPGMRSAVVLGGSGALAGFIIQGLVAQGVAVLATASAGREAVPLGCGARRVLASGATLEQLRAAARELPGACADLVVDTVGNAASAPLALALCAYGGQFVPCTGYAPLPPVQQWPRALSVHDLFLGGAVDHADPAVRGSIGLIGSQLAEAIDKGGMRAPPATTMAADALPDLLRALQSGQVAGKYVARFAKDET